MKVTVRLRYWRQKRALSIPDLSEKAHVSSDTINKIENHGWIPRPSVLRRLAEGLEITLDELQIVTEDEIVLQKAS